MSDRETRQRSAMDDDAMRETHYDPNPNERGKWISALIALIGLWMIAEAFLFDLAASQLWNDIVIGLLLLAVGGYNYYRQMNEQYGSVGAASVAALVGLWLIAAPFLLGTGAGAAETANNVGFWNDILIGLVTFVLGAYSAYKIRDWRETTRAAA